MATPSPYQPLFVFDSAVADGHFTRLQIDPNEGSLISVGMCPSGNPAPPVFDFPFSPASTPAKPAAHGLPLFLIQFSRYDLGTNQLFDPENTVARDFVNYSVDPALIRARETFVTVERAAGSARIIYDSVRPSHFTNLPDSLKDPLDPIKVVLRFSRPAGRINAGWINLDISYTCPKQFRDARDRFAWQATLAFPRFKIDKSKTVREGPGGSPTRDWSVLLPGGDVGVIKGLKDPQFHDMAVQLGALYRPEPGANLLRAVAVMATDVLGHKKFFAYKHRDPEDKDPTSDVMACNFVAPIHLLKQQYAQPVDPKNRTFNFTLSGGDRYGFGGGRTVYRIRALQVKGNGAPLDWTDVANVYRQWAKVNRPNYFTKVVPRAANAQGPMDTMSPTTVVTNYGLDGPLSPSSAQQDLAKWLEIHPIKVDGKTDVPNNQNVTLQDRLAEIRQRVNNSRNEAKLEAQIWGYELGGYYQWVAGYPPITSVLSNVEGKPDRFRAAMDELAGGQVFPNITTDFVRVLFNRKRFGGHVVWDGSKWVEAITEAFPAAFTDTSRNPNQAACQIITSGGLYNDPHDHAQGSTQHNRIFLIKTNEEEIVQESQPGCADAETLCQYPQLGPYGIVGGSAVLGKRIYQQDLLSLCPQDDVLRIYLDKCLNNGALKYGARLVEFMKPTFDYCYDKTHRHIFAAVPSTLYNNVIGYGPWVTLRFQQVVMKIQRLGQGLDQRADGVTDQSFALTREFVPFEPMLPYFNEYYGRSAVLQYVYGEAISIKSSPGFASAPYRHPGYKDRRKSVPIPATALDFMLKTDTTSESALPSREQLRQKCVAYFNDYFEVESSGIAPLNYTTGDGTKYTYNRIVEDVFNLKAYFFTLGAEAVIGERLHVPSIWFDPPTEPNEEVIKMAARAAQLHLRFAKFLRGGYILGQTKILNDNSTLYARAAGLRTFDDAVEFKSVVTRPATLDVGPDFISRGVDKDEFCSVSSSPRIHHLCWQRKVGAGLRTLYLFANVGNTPTPLKFSYTRGLDSTPGWKKVITVFDGRDSLGVDLPAAPVTLGSTEGGFIPARSNLAPRSFAAVLIFK
jgi:hypothetical protein